MRMKCFIFFVMLGFSSSMLGQGFKKEVLFSIDNKPYYSDEFSRIYNKNIDLVKDESQKDLNQYLDLFIGYKLKIAKAYKLELNKNPKYVAELSSYRTQLAKNYLTDSKVTQELLEEAYNRYLSEIKASHILILADENASPTDTLKAYNQIVEIRKKIQNGADFETLAIENSQDPSAKDNKGNLGYFSVFRMVYPFESAAYNTKKGEVSKIIRTKFGYHIIKVTDIRKNRGEISVAHIMLMKQNDATSEEKSKTIINDIYKKIQQGENFGDLAKQFSEDKSTSDKNGVINRFASGQLSSAEFEDMAFALSKQKPLSVPFQSDFGWHIIKFQEQYPVKSLKEMTSELEEKIKKDERSRKISNSVNNKLRKEFPIQRDNNLYTAIKKIVATDLKRETWKKPTDKIFEKKLFAIKNKTVTATKFVDFLDNQRKGFLSSKINDNILVDNTYELFVDSELNQYYNDNLETKFAEFGYIMDEYRDGLLLFDLMEKEIWEKSKNDSIGLQKFYDINKDKYRWKNRVDISILSSTKLDFIAKAQKMLKENKSIEFIKEQLNTADNVEVMQNQGIYELENPIVPKNVKFELGLTDIVKQGEYYFVSKVNKLLFEGTKTLNECKGKLVNDYQQYLEENWVSDLKKEFTILVNQDAFVKAKKEIKQK